MLSRKAKRMFYIVAGPIMKLNGLRFRYFSKRKSDAIKVHLGPGRNNYLDGWLNIDANVFTGKCDLWADLRNQLPFKDNEVEAFYSHHMIEHLPDIRFHLEEVYRCLKPGCIYRVGGPNGDSAIAKFTEHDVKWFSDYPDSRKSIGGRFENFIFCRQEHLTILTFSYLEELLSDIGFINIKKMLPMKETDYPMIFQDCLLKEHERDFVNPHTLILECTKAER